MERAPGRDGPPSALTVPQLVCAVDGQALQVVPSAAPTSSGSWGPGSSLTLGQLRFCRQAQRGKAQLRLYKHDEQLQAIGIF